MAVLIVCEPVDLHASAVAWALAKHDAEATLWHPAPPFATASSVRLDATSVIFGFAGKTGKCLPSASAYDAVWMRRWPEPVFPAGFRDSGKHASLDALLSYHGGLLELLPRGILWANSPEGRRAASFAARQLAAAVSAGLSIPATIVTDDSSEARDFIAAHAGAVVCKPLLRPGRTRTGPGTFRTATGPVSKANLDDPQALVWSPGIFQQVVPRAHHLRVNMFGRTCVSARIFERDPDGGTTPQIGTKVAPHELPEAVARKLHALMDDLGLVMGVAEFTVTPQGDHIFLELDEQGPSLWDEEMCPDLPLLDTCARFLASGDPRFKLEVVPGGGIRLDDFMEQEAVRSRQMNAGSLSAGGTSASARLRNHGPPGGRSESRPRRVGLL